MAIGPQGPLRKDDGPACHVCGCTEHNACIIQTDETFTEGLAKAVRMPPTRMPRLLTCSWVERPHWFPPLCTACAGSAGDLAATLKHVHRRLMRYGGNPEKLAQTDRIVGDAIARWKKHSKRA